MNLYKNLTVILAAACYLMIIIPGQASVIKTSAVKQSCATDIKMHPAEKDSQNVGFIWPEGIKAGVSLTFDDARLSQIDKGIPLLDKHGVKATFYVSPLQMMKRIEKWKEAVANGHEIIHLLIPAQEISPLPEIMPWKIIPLKKYKWNLILPAGLSEKMQV